MGQEALHDHIGCPDFDVTLYSKNKKNFGKLLDMLCAQKEIAKPRFEMYAIEYIIRQIKTRMHSFKQEWHMTPNQYAESP